MEYRIVPIFGWTDGGIGIVVMAGENGNYPSPRTQALIIATIPALIASGSLGHAATIWARSSRDAADAGSPVGLSDETDD